MKIKELNLDAFGRFINRTIKFKDGINIVYGDNEKGKSTIFKFIESILFGFDNNNSKDFEKYDPWFSDEYKGSIIIEKNTNEYKLNRDFKNKTIKIDGEIIDSNNEKESLSYDKYGHELLGIDRNIYSNTISIAQLESKTDTDLLIELKNKIENLGRTRDQKINIENVFDKLGKQKNLEKLETIEEDIFNLSIQLEEIEEIKEKPKSIIGLIKEKKEALKKLLKRKEEIKPLTNIKNFREVEIKFEKAEEIKKEMELLSGDILSMKRDMDIEIEDYEKLIILSSENEKLKEEISNVEEDLNRLEKEEIYIKNDFQKFKNIPESNFISQYELYKNNEKIMERLQEKLNKLKVELDEIKAKKYSEIILNYNELSKENKRKKYLEGILKGNIIDALKNKLKKERNKKWIKLIFAAIFIIGVPAASYFAVELYNNSNIYFINVLIIAGIFLLSKLSRNNLIIKNIQGEIKEIHSKEAEYKEECVVLEENKDKILEKYNCTNKKDFRSLYYDAIDNQKLLEEKLNTYETLEEEIFYLNKKSKDIEEYLNEYLNKFGYNEINDENIRKLNKKYNESEVKFNSLENLEKEIKDKREKKQSIDEEFKSNKKEIDSILDTSGVNTKDEFKEAFKVQAKLKEKVSLKNNKKEILKNILKEDNYEDIKEKYKQINKIRAEKNFTSFDEIIKEERFLEEEIKEIKEEIDSYFQEINDLENYERNYLLEENIQDLKREKAAIEKNNKIIEEAINNILEISKKIKEEFMPELQKNLEKYFLLLTDNKYERVYINEEFDIYVKDKEKEDKIKLDYLSLGTIDQMYFSLRFSLINIMFSEDEVPIILDDCFTQYDEDRLRNVLDILVKIKEDYQILLFTCHKREEKFFEEKGIEINMVNL